MILIVSYYVLKNILDVGSCFISSGFLVLQVNEKKESFFLYLFYRLNYQAKYICMFVSRGKADKICFPELF